MVGYFYSDVFLKVYLLTACFFLIFICHLFIFLIFFWFYSLFIYISFSVLFLILMNK